MINRSASAVGPLKTVINRTLANMTAPTITLTDGPDIDLPLQSTPPGILTDLPQRNGASSLSSEAMHTIP